MLENLSDRWLVEQYLLFKSEGSFSKLYDKHTSVLFKIAMQITDGNTANAEEIVQNTWLKAIPKLNQFRWESTLRTWLISILIYAGKEYFRKSISYWDYDQVPDPVAAPQRSAEKIDLEKAISELPPGYKVVFVLHDIEGYKHEEIGNLLGIHAGTSKSQLSNARKMLKNYLMN